MGAVAELPAGATVVDCPCGAGPALRALPADGRLRYVGVDLSPAMLARARRRAEQRGLSGVPARILRPGGRLLGASFVRGTDTLRQRLLVRPHLGDFGPIGTQIEIEAWLAAAGFELSEESRSGPMLFFAAQLPG